ncbi:MAG: AI-2E family transporter [Hydrococcus sp. RM1_1_31]|nr:AI-2E family transporter [Hydrococcus sp. RM1_1_31]
MGIGISLIRSQLLGFSASFYVFSVSDYHFITANLLAFVLNYPVRLFISRGVKRDRAILLVVLLALLVVIVLGLTLAPALIGQINDLIAGLPTWIESSSQQIQSLDRWAAGRRLPLDFSGLIGQLTERLAEQLQALTGQFLGVVLITLGSVFNLIFILVMTFYLLLQGEQLWNGIFNGFLDLMILSYANCCDKISITILSDRHL